MKKLLFLLSFIALAFGASAQYGFAAHAPHIAGDTLNNADTVTKVIKVTGGFSCTGIQININKLSGTVAGKAYLYQSADGVNYTVTDSATYTTLSTTIPSIASPSVTAVATFNKTLTPWPYIAVVATSSGTVSADVNVYYTLRKYTSTYAY